MITKRFSQKNEDDWEILDRNHHFAYAHSSYQAKKIIKELNKLVETNRELYKENKQLKKALLDIGDDRDYYKSKASNLEEGYIQLQDKEILLKEENEQLKQLIKETLEITPMEHSLAVKLKNSIREMYE